MIQDPSGLLQRVSELEPLCADARIRRAVESGDPFKVYRALLLARLLRRLPAHRPTIDLLVRSRRLFARPLKRSPWLGTVNSVGTTLLGHDEQDADGTWIATHCIVALFAVPLLPLGAYLVTGGERSGLSTSWRIFARVPLGLGAWLWSRGVAVAVAASIAAGAYGTLHASRHGTVHVVNGFSSPIAVELAGVRQDVAAGGHVAVVVPTGRHAVRALAGDGAEVDATALEVRAGRALLVWNVAGGAPVFSAEVTYRSGPAPADEKPNEIDYCGKRVVQLSNVDYAFTSPPAQISMPRGATRVSRRYVDVGRSGDASGAVVCQYLLGRAGRDRDALTVAEAQARLTRWAPETASQALALARGVGDADVERVARAARDAHPDDLSTQRIYQHAMQWVGKESALVEEYRALAAARPDDPAAAYLYARLLRGPELAAEIERLAARFPADPNLLRLSIWSRADAGAWDAVDAAWRKLSAAAPAQASEVLDDEVTALVAQDRAADALKLLREQFDRPDAPDRATAAELYARVAPLAGELVPGALLDRLEKKDGPSPVSRARSGLPVSGRELPAVVDVLRLAATDPANALSRAATLPLVETISLDAATWTLLFGEAARTGATKAETALARASPLVRVELESLRRYVRAETPALVPGLPAVVRSAARFVRSRNESIAPADRARLVADARREDWLRTNVTKAIAAWTPGAAGR